MTSLLPAGGCARQKSGENAKKLTIAAAANMQFALEDIVSSFMEESGIACEMVISSSGKLTAQIREGAPYDVFLSADMRYPETLFESGYALAPPEVYARGQLVLWFADPPSLPDSISAAASVSAASVPTASVPAASSDSSESTFRPASLTSPDIKHIAVANPETAPYGVAAVAFMSHTGLYEKVASRLVYGESISQVNHFMHSGAVEAGFTALSALFASDLTQRGGWVTLDPATYPPIEQGAVVLRDDERQGERVAAEFYKFLFSAKCKTILQAHGYLVN